MPTKVSVADIAMRFDALLSGSASRETIEGWAFSCLKAQDAGELFFEPASDESRLWNAITYLSGVALRTQPNVYLHGPEDFAEFRQKHAL